MRRSLALLTVAALGSFASGADASASSVLLREKGSQVVVVDRATRQTLLNLSRQPGEKLDVLRSGPSLLVIRFQRGRLQLTAWNLNPRKVVWTDQQEAALLNRYGVRGKTFFVESATSGAEITVRTLLWTAKEQSWESVGGRLVAESKMALLFNQENGVDPYDPVLLDYRWYDLSRHRLDMHRFTISPRQGCGDVMMPADEEKPIRYTSQYIYAIRQDACGTFVARYRWGVSPDAPPLVYPQPRP